MAIEIVDLPINSMVIFHSLCKRLPEGTPLYKCWSKPQKHPIQLGWFVPGR